MVHSAVGELFIVRDKRRMGSLFATVGFVIRKPTTWTEGFDKKVTMRTEKNEVNDFIVVGNEETVLKHESTTRRKAEALLYAAK